jgi:hypothetical protein
MLDVSGLGGSGPVWSLVGILLGLVWVLIKMLLAEKDKRIADATNNLQNIVQPIADIGKTLERIEDKTLVAKGRK